MGSNAMTETAATVKPMATTIIISSSEKPFCFLDAIIPCWANRPILQMLAALGAGRAPVSEKLNRLTGRNLRCLPGEQSEAHLLRGGRLHPRKALQWRQSTTVQCRDIGLL
jgi:hypothetical protein